MIHHFIVICNEITSDVVPVVDKLVDNYQSLECKALLVQCTKKDDEEGKDITWGSLDSIKSMINSDKCGCTEIDLKEATNDLHLAADKLPASGVILDVYIWPPQNPDRSEYILFLGALRRLKDWHNARVTLFDPNPDQNTEFLQKFLSAEVNFRMDMFNVDDGKDLMWRGKLSVCDKLENKGLTIPGVCLYKLDERSTDLQFPLLSSSQSQEQESNGCQLGRMIEVLDEIHLHTIPDLFKTPHVYKLCLYQKHGYSQVVMNYIQQNTETGMLARVPVYPSYKAQTLCEEVNLSTELWKENITADIQYAQEPEEDLLDDYEFLYFIITSPDRNCVPQNFVAYAYLLRHPYHINGSIVTTMYHQSLCSVKGDNLEESVDLSSLPFMNWETLKQVEADVISVQKTMLQRLYDEKHANNLSTEMDIQQLMSYMTDIRLSYLSKLKAKLQSSKPTERRCRKFIKREIYEISENTNDWPERLILQYMESQKRCLSRLQSSESMPMSSPLQPCETSTSIDIQSFLKFFNLDGTASALKLSPVRRRHPSRTKSKFSTPDTVASHLTLWPESKDLASHDIYYNVDKKSEKVNSHLNKIREKYVKNETYSSCLSSVVTFPRATKKRLVNDSMELRRSPRKRAQKSVLDENMLEQKKSRLSDVQLPIKSLDEKTSHRRFSTPHAIVPRRSRSSLTQVHPDVLPQRRSSDIGLVKSSSSAPRHTDKLRRESTGGNTSFTSPNGDIEKKESRSDRHKRRLQDIVDSVLESNGVSKTDPIYTSCSTRLFKVTKLFVMDLPNSRNLKDEMRKIAEGQVKQVIDVDRSREASKQNKHKKSV